MNAKIYEQIILRIDVVGIFILDVLRWTILQKFSPISMETHCDNYILCDTVATV